MANKVIKHYYYDEPMEANSSKLEPDKSKSISELSLDELHCMINRLRCEREAEVLVRSLNRSSGQKDTYEQPFKIDTTTPINQLYHYGISGQKWGVRRYQNEDGSRTPAGKKKEDQQAKSEDHLQSRASKSKATSGLSNDELRKLNERLQLESTYKTLTSEQLKRSESFVTRAIKKGGEDALGAFAKGVFLGGAKVLVKEMSPQFAEVAFNVKEKKD